MMAFSDATACMGQLPFRGYEQIIRCTLDDLASENHGHVKRSYPTAKQQERRRSY